MYMLTINERAFMLTQTETRNTEIWDGAYTDIFEGTLNVKCDGSSIWDDTNGKEVTVTQIAVHELKLPEFSCEGYTEINVRHNANWEIYTDRGFEKAISDFLGFAVMFTEQGMQQHGIASMEAAD